MRKVNVILKVENKHNSIEYERKVHYADTFGARLIGLMFKKSISESDAWLITPCKQIHTFFMKFAIDVVFIDKCGIVEEVVKNMRSGRISKYISSSYSVLELPVGTIDKLGISKDSNIQIKGEMS